MSDFETQTRAHIEYVAKMLMIIAGELIVRGENHDASKLEDPEREAFAKVSYKLSEMVYGSPEYEASKKELGEALNHHYSLADHHPEHFPGGISDMNLLQFAEMICDWYASASRMQTRDLEGSIQMGKKRFGFGPEIENLIRNTFTHLEKVEKGDFPEPQSDPELKNKLRKMFESTR